MGATQVVTVDALTGYEGTSTAWAMAQYLHNQQLIAIPKTPRRNILSISFIPFILFIPGNIHRSLPLISTPAPSLIETRLPGAARASNPVGGEMQYN